MTAFAEQEDTRFSWEIRSVNHRFLEVSFRLPEGFRDLERTFRAVVREAGVKRGKIDATLRMPRNAPAQSLNLDRQTLLHLLATLEQIRRDAPEIANPDPLELLRWPGVMVDSVSAEAKEGLRNAIEQSFRETLTAFIAHREREGAEMDALLLAKLAEIEALVEAIRGLTRSLTVEIKDRLQARLRDLAAKVDPARLEQEVALIAQRADIAEEIDRLQIHATECRTSLAGPGPHGRRLDFLMQELNREANTLAAKSILGECSQRAVDLKVIIEQMREQVQNIE